MLSGQGEPERCDPRRIVGRNLRARRRALGMNQAQLGRLAQIRQGHISAIERGERAPSLDLLFALARALQVEPGLLVAVAPEDHRCGPEISAGLQALCAHVASRHGGVAMAAGLGEDVRRMTVTEQCVLVLLIEQVVPAAEPRTRIGRKRFRVAGSAAATRFRVDLDAATRIVAEGCERFLSRVVACPAPDPQHPLSEPIRMAWVASCHRPIPGPGRSDAEPRQWVLYLTPPAAWYLAQLAAALRDKPALRRAWGAPA